MNLRPETISTEHRAGRQLGYAIESEHKGAKVLVTVSVEREDGGRRYHETFALRPWWNGAARMLSVEVYNSGDYAKGIREIRCWVVNLESGDLMRARDKRGQGALISYAAQCALRYAFTGRVPNPGNGKVECVEADVCGHCGKLLTDDESIRVGLGPTCSKELGVARRTSSPTLRATSSV